MPKIATILLPQCFKRIIFLCRKLRKEYEFLVKPSGHPSDFIFLLKPKELQIFLLYKHWSWILYSFSLVTRQNQPKSTLREWKMYSFPESVGVENIFLPADFGKEYVFHSHSLNLATISPIILPQ